MKKGNRQNGQSVKVWDQPGVWKDQLIGVQFISKLDRKHCRMLVELPIKHINLQYMLHKMRSATTPSYGRCGAEKETSVHILRECPASEKVRMQTTGFARMDPEQIKEARLSGIVALKGTGLLNTPYEFIERYKVMGLSPVVSMGTHLAKKKKKKELEC